MIPLALPAINGRVKRILSSAVVMAVALGSSPLALAQSQATTDVDAATTAEQQSPMAPEQAQTEAPKPPTLDQLISGAAPYDPPPAPAAVAAPAALPDPVVAAPAPPSQAAPYASPAQRAAPTSTRGPVFIHERGATPDAPPTPRDTAYENRVLGVFHAQQGRQGALDGRWRVAAGGVDVYILQLSDPGAGESRVEGAWRNLRREGSLDASGFVDQVTREGDEVVVRFTDASQRSAEIRLRNSAGGGWIGRIVWPEGGSNIAMTRDVSVETAAFAVPAYVQPPPPPPPRAKPAPARSKATAKKSRRPVAPSRARAKKR